jgi:NADH-quinone oxidoreductase subunit K
LSKPAAGCPNRREEVNTLGSVPLQAYIIVSAVVFAIGGAGVLVRRSPLVMLMCIELMWNAVNLTFLAFYRWHGVPDGQVFAFLIITVAAAEAAIGLAIVVLLFRRRDTVDIDDIRQLRG